MAKDPSLLTMKTFALPWSARATDEGPSRVYQRRRLAAPEGEGQTARRQRRRGSRGGRGRGDVTGRGEVGEQTRNVFTPSQRRRTRLRPQLRGSTFDPTQIVETTICGVCHFGGFGVLPLDARITYQPNQFVSYMSFREANPESKDPMEKRTE